MITKDYGALLEGVEALNLAVSVLRDLCDLFVEGAQRSARLVAEGRSLARGTVPAWVNAAADVRISKFAAGSLENLLGAEASSAAWAPARPRVLPKPPSLAPKTRVAHV